MKRAIVFMVIMAAIGISVSASANKYSHRENVTRADILSAEATESMSDCMTYSASHVSRGRSQDQAMFQKQFGDPIEKTGVLSTFNYDDYTKITLDCSKAKCSCRCFGKY